MLVAHAYNSRDRDQEDCGLRTAGANSFKEPVSKIPNTKKGLADWLKR
jgi:hypothetical protein